MASKTAKKEWSVVKYTDGLLGICHISEVNKEDNRVETVSEHIQYSDAVKARDAYGNKNKKLTVQK